MAKHGGMYIYPKVHPKRSGDGIQNQSVCSPGGLFVTKFEYRFYDRMSENFCSNKLSGGLTNT